MKSFNIALCSFGMSGTLFHAPFISLHKGLNLYAVWERSKNLVQDFYPEAKSYRTYEEILQDDAVDLVVVNTPSYTHYEYAKMALKASKHVIVEKPFTATAAQAEELDKLAFVQGVKISVFQNRRFDSDFKTVRSIKESGLLGDILEGELHYDRFNLTLSPKAHKETPGPAVGVLYDLGPHLIDQALQLFGTPSAVFGDVMITRPGSQVDDYFEILLYYPNKRVRLKSGYQVREPFPSFVLHGSKGSFLKSRADVQETDLQAKKSPADPYWGMEPEAAQGFLHTEKDGVIIKEHVPSLQGNYMEYYDGVFNALAHNEKMPVTGEEGIWVMKVIEAAKKSSDEKRVVTL